LVSVIRNLGAPERFGERQYRATLDPTFFVALTGTTAMLDRISLDTPLVELRSSRQTNRKFLHCLDDHQKDQQKRDLLTARFRNAFRKSVEGIIEAGRVLIEAKNELEHGQFIDWVERDLRFGPAQECGRGLGLRKVQMLMFLAKNEVISNANHWCAFPPSWRTLWELSQIRPKQRLLDLIASGKINPGMTREEAFALNHKSSGERSPTPRLKREIAALLNVCIFLGGGDGVLAHIRELKDVSNVPAAKEFGRAARWAKQKIAERRRANSATILLVLRRKMEALGTIRSAAVRSRH
jgi:hypothetical protein